MKFLVIPDSFKGSMSSEEFCFIAKNAIGKYNENYEVTAYPLADGGEGSVECLTDAVGGRIVGGKVSDGNFFTVNATYGVNEDTAYIGVANSSGLPKTMIKDPLFTTTFGMGEQIKQAIKLGKKKIVLCLGGSSTNDGGAGLVCALGGKFFDENSVEFVPSGGTLNKIATIDLTDFENTIEGVTFIALCDVNNPLLGEKGCTYTYAPQKGAKNRDLEMLEANMRHYAEKTAFLGVDSSFPGAGAAGGLGYCVKAFLKGELVSGINYFLDVINFDSIAKDADYIISGEGRFDKTSIMGKAVGGIAKRAAALGKKVTVFCGEDALCDYSGFAIDNVYALNDKNLSTADNILHTQTHFAVALEKFLTEINNG